MCKNLLKYLFRFIINWKKVYFEQKRGKMIFFGKLLCDWYIEKLFIVNVLLDFLDINIINKNI